MKARELRIGNIVHYPVEGVLEFCTLDAHDIEIMDRSQPYCDEHKPIPLSEIILLKFGFSINECKLFQDDKEITKYATLSIEPRSYNAQLISYDMSVVNLNDCDDGIIGIDIKYVHQLQNLYYALTGNELTLK